MTTLAEPMARPAFWTFTVRNVGQGELEAGVRRLRGDFAPASPTGHLRGRAVPLALARGRARWGA